MVTLAVNDQGVGMSKADIRKLFIKFNRVDNPLSVQVGGMGLGLYWAKKIIDLHGGSIAVTSSPNVGSTFTITLPVGGKGKSTNTLNKVEQLRSVAHKEMK